MLTVCWAAKGGSGTTVVAATLALSPGPALLIDLAGDLPAALGVPEPAGPGLHDWAASTAEPDRLAALEIDATPDTGLIAAGRRQIVATERWELLAERLHRDRRRVIVDAGTGEPPHALLRAAERAWLVTRPCYLSLRAAVRQTARPNGVVLIDEPGRALGEFEVAAALGAPVVATLLVDPAVARAVDAGLVVARLPGAYRRRVGAAA
jgi:hypothetical protein